MTAHAYRAMLRRKIDQRLAVARYDAATKGCDAQTDYSDRWDGQAEAYADVLQLLTEDGDDL